ncbi:MAG: metallophosphoesterase [Candidatus Limnocylindrales bacterium]
MSRQIKVFYATDIHGSERCFRKFINAGAFYGADVLIMGGDITGKMIVPIVEESAGRFVAEVFGQTRRFDETELPGIQRLIGDAGYYAARMTPDELEELHADPAKVEAAFKQLMTATLSRWLDFAAERLGPTGPMCIVSPGNDDQPFIDGLLSSSTRVINPDDRVIELPGGFELVSFGYSNVTPWASPRELEEPELLARIEAVAAQATHADRTIFNLHVPPKETPLDQAILLKPDLSPVLRNGSPVVGGVGSSAVRTALERHQPLVGLHGHIHESRGSSRIGRSTVFNPGSEYSDGVLRGLILTLEAGKGIRGSQFIAG